MSEKEIVIASPRSKTVSSSLLSTDGRWNLIVAGSTMAVVIISIYFMYRFIKTVNRRFQSLEEVIGKIIEKNNSLHHLLQASPPQQQHHYAPPPPPAVSPVYQPPVASQAPPQNLDTEIQAELKELDSPPPVPEKIDVADKEEVEGRVE